MSIKFLALETNVVRALQAGEADANNLVAEKTISTGGSTPCRHCLEHIEEGEAMLIVAHKPFATVQPYAEQGPIFLHEKPCLRHDETTQTPAMFLEWEQLMIRGYTADERIKYGTGKVVTTDKLAERCSTILKDEEIRFVHVRSASNNCFQCRVERA